ncbi:MAG: laccase [Holophagae bacterium]|nr:MAG: laccase [Holophagae bacterium]
MPVHRTREIAAIERRVAGEPALELEDGGAVVLFGLGPPLQRLPPQQRAAAIVADLAPVLRSIRWARQVHGATVLAVEDGGGDPVDCIGDADGLVTSRAGCGLVVWTADCVPVALVSPRAIAMVHAGWRGAAAGIVAAAVRRLSESGGHHRQLRAFLGPAVCGRHYQVGPEVIEALAQTGVPRPAWLAGDHVDLRSLLAAQLAALGVGGVQTVGPCTVETPDLASYRRDGAAAGRQWSLVWRMADGG